MHYYRLRYLRTFFCCLFAISKLHTISFTNQDWTLGSLLKTQTTKSFLLSNVNLIYHCPQNTCGIGFAFCHALEETNYSGAREAPWVSKFVNPLIRKTLVLTPAYLRPYRLWERVRGVPRQPDRGRRNAIFSCS